jgi:hypothetical protein
VNFCDVRKELGSVHFDALRQDADGYFEAVVVKERLAIVARKLEDLFGAPAWPSKERLSAHARKAIKDHGGIRTGQTLYCAANGGCIIIAMLWPWQDGLHTTLKVMQE